MIFKCSFRRSGDGTSRTGADLIWRNPSRSPIIPRMTTPISAFVPEPALAERVRALAEARSVSADAAFSAAVSVGTTLLELEATVRARMSADPGQSYAARLLQGPEDSLLKKLAEEAAEAALAAKGGNSDALVRETADLWFHCVAALIRYNRGVGEVADELSARAGTSGLAEKAARTQ